MDLLELLKELLAHATASTLPAGDQRAEAILGLLRERATDDLDLEALDHASVEQFEALYAGGQYDPKDAATLVAYGDVTAAIRLLRAEQDQALVEQDAQITAIAGRVRTVPAAAAAEQQPADTGQTGNPATAPSDEGQNPGGTTGTQPGDGQPPAGENPESGAPQGQPATEPVGEPNVPGAALVPATPTSAPVAATRRTSTAVALNGGGTRQPAAPARTGSNVLCRYTMTAAAEVPDMPFGQALTMEQLALASVDRFLSLPVGQPVNGGVVKANVARIARNYDPAVTLRGDQSDVDLLDRIADERNLPGGSLVAAAKQRVLTAAAQAPSVINDVWCVPSETDYSLCPSLATDEGMLDIPKAGMPKRAGIRFPRWNQYPEQAADASRNGWHGTAIIYPETPQNPGTGLDNPAYFHSTANGGLGNTKKCISGPCVDWVEYRANLAYLCIESDLLRDKVWPEGITRFKSDVLLHHQHYLNELYLAYIAAHSDPIPAFSVMNGAGSIGSVSLTVMDRLGLLIAWMRGAYKMSKTATLELVLPEWFLEYLKRDLEKKQNRPSGSVKLAEITDLFSDYATRVQWVRDWQELPNGAPVGPDGNKRVMPPDAWPSNVQILAYPAGSWALSEGNIINLGVQYDYTLLKENRYSASFTEDSWMLINRCNRTFTLQLTDLCANGAVGPARDVCPRPTGGGAAAVEAAPEQPQQEQTTPAIEQGIGTATGAAAEAPDAGGAAGPGGDSAPTSKTAASRSTTTSSTTSSSTKK